LEPLAPFSCRPGQSAAKPPRALRGKVLWSASPWPLHLAAALPPPPLLPSSYLSCGQDSSLLAQDSGRAEYKAGKVWRIGYLGNFPFTPVNEKPTRVTLHHVQDCPDCTCAGAQFNEIPNFEACHYKAPRIATAATGTPEISAGARTPARSSAAG